MRTKKPWQHEEVLRNLYSEQLLPLRTIANILNTTPSNVQYWMKKFNIERRKFEIGDLNRGKTLFPAEIQKLSEIAKKRFEDPTNHPMYGHKHTEESKQKMSETKRKNNIEED